ncbi:CGNR zinc finger domain-containing protein [Herbaspirillum sp. GCM10030257]|uniref:CGNR zinc finger domain-containing protein n=1 Tax=Herbaspirillum sp. GCM10030257 TaxID=3273393 RepID=UPI003620DA65
MQVDNSANEALMLGDHLAMDLLNTEMRNGGKIIECWNTGSDVLRWLERHDIIAAAAGATVDHAALLAQGKALRALARQLITEVKNGEVIDIGPLNQYLLKYISAPQLERNGKGHLTMVRIPRGDTVASLLGPVAEAVAQLLAECNFALVKKCEHPECILWFYDRTKSHKRRWCSMALCGNRHKAAQFRKRSSGEAV